MGWYQQSMLRRQTSRPKPYVPKAASPSVLLRPSQKCVIQWLFRRASYPEGLADIDVSLPIGPRTAGAEGKTAADTQCPGDGVTDTIVQRLPMPGKEFRQYGTADGVLHAPIPLRLRAAEQRPAPDAAILPRRPIEGDLRITDLPSHPALGQKRNLPRHPLCHGPPHKGKALRLHPFIPSVPPMTSSFSRARKTVSKSAGFSWTEGSRPPAPQRAGP